MNIEYILSSLIQSLLGVDIDVSLLAGTVLAYVQIAAFVGIVISIVLIVVIIYARIQMHEIEHAGWHHREEHAAHHEHVAHTSPSSAQWKQVIALASSGHSSDWRRAILEADIMLGAMLTDKGYAGKSIGDQLKTANPFQFTTLNQAWSAHKVRNEIAHGGEAYELTERDFQATLNNYRLVFEEFHYI